MGFKISWIGFEGLNKAAALSRLSMIDTGVPDEANEAPFSMAQLPTGWTILFENAFRYPIDTSKLAALSVGTRLVACQVHEGVMFSYAIEFIDGECIWSMSHAPDEGPSDFTFAGSPPEGFEEIQMRLTAQQAKSGGEHSDVDYIFDIPVEVAALLTGYRHDRWKFDWGEPEFTIVEGQPKPAKKSWLSQLFGGR